MGSMSVYRSLQRPLLSDVHHAAEHIIGPEKIGRQTSPTTPKQDWTGQRKANPIGILLPRTERWIAALPFEFQPTATARAFPRIANQLAILWPMPGELASYFIELLVDNRGGRKGFPIRVLSELHALRHYYASLHP